MSDSNPAGAERSNWRWVVCGLLLLATTLNYMDRTALNQSVNPILRDLGLNNRDYANLESVFDLGFGLGTLCTGWLVDKVNVRWVYPAVVALWSTVGFATGFATGFVELLLCRAALGLFEAGNWPCGIRTTRSLPPEERPLGNALFQSGTGIGAIATPIVLLLLEQMYGKDAPGLWRVSFQVIGAVGLVWVLVWFAVQLAHPLPPLPPVNTAGGRFVDVLRDHRFWLLVCVIIGVNTAWHTVRPWMPRYLNVVHGFKEGEIQVAGIYYYVAADVGSWTVGLLVLLFARRGYALTRLRFIAYAMCTGLVLSAALLTQWPRGPHLMANFCVVGFGALGLFPIYFALSQSLSARHQGKVTGTLGCINALYLAGMRQVHGRLAEADRYDLLFATAGIPALLSLCVLLLFWKSDKSG